ncbi:MAG TPA: glycosyltransferase family 9 protein [Candidatus Brocadiia bacterium]|nr:glycosyltransferase family 9 protein [Candidatus Brocadiia bacterium]
MRILIARESGGWGDVLCTLFAARGLRLAHPDAHISYFCMRPFDAFLRVVAPDINRVIPFGETDGEPPRRVRPRRRAMNQPVDLAAYGLRGRYDLVVDCWCPADREERATAGRARRSRIEAFCDAAGVACPPVPRLARPPAAMAAAARVLAEFRPAGRPTVLIQPRSARVTKNWPAGHVARLVDLLKARGVVPFSVGVDGSGVAGLPHVMGLSHVQVAAVAASVDCIVAPDSGLFHLAAFVATPCVAIFGPTDPRQYVRHYPLARFLWRPEAFAGRCGIPCLYLPENGFPPQGMCLEEGACMAAVEPQAAAEAVMEILERGSGVLGLRASAPSSPLPSPKTPSPKPPV